ncbi:phage protein [Pseudomonas sp. NPDC098747]|uniref:phage protein n=1 Tax=Pseudomonas sp. NPDC098747 TaxID=3364487 RepID=UPI00383A09CB
MIVPQYIRKISLTVGDEAEAIDLSDLRIRFSVRRGDYQTPNSADIRVYNVSTQTALKVDREFTRIRLEAGYEGSYGLIFEGTVKQVRPGRESQTDTYIDITAADGDAAYNFAFISTTLVAGATPTDQINACAKAMESYGVTSPELPPNLPVWALPRGVAMFGLVRDQLADISRTIGCSWSIQDGRLTIVPENGYLEGGAAVINSATGMIGLPEQVQNGINVKMLLNPNVKIGRSLQINNSSIQQYRFGISVADQAQNYAIDMQNRTNSDGFYKVFTATHYGDTRENDWYTEAQCLSIDITVVQSKTVSAMTPGVISSEGAIKYW